jgi:hypothetical protein
VCSAASAKEECAEALKFMVHFVGDVHQPLHCADRNGDRGGNKRLVFFLDRKRAMALHAVWDTQILLHDKGKTKILDYALWLNEQVTPEQTAEWSKGTPEDWAAVEQVYRDVPEGGAPPKIDAAYVHRAEPVVEAQLERSGVRLAAVLNRTLRHE